VTQPREVKDAAQGSTTASHFAILDDAGELSPLFAGPHEDESGFENESLFESEAR
jgi:hypothetical protein